MHLRSLEIEKEIGRQEGLASEYGNLGILYQKSGEFRRAEEVLLRSLDIELQLGRKEGIAADYDNLGRQALNRGDLAMACARWAKSLSLYQEIGAEHMVTRVGSWMREAGCQVSNASPD